MGIQINIIAGRDKGSSSVTASGTFQHVITDEEKTSFKIGDSQLKDAINVYFGKRPNDAYLKSDTPWGDLYKTYSWPQVQMVFVVQSAEILEITSEPTIVKTQEFSNNSSNTGNFNVAISESVNNTASSSWTKGNKVTLGQKFEYGVSFLGTGAKGETSMSYEHSWGEGGEESKSVTVGSTSSVSVTLEPGEAILAELSASRGVMKVRIRYNAYLIGNTAINYNPTYKGHHFWSLGISSVMKSGSISNSIQSTEDIEIGYYSDSKIELKDKVSKRLKTTVNTDDVPAS
ncbi:MAG: hypothetical protein RPT11_10130 [Bermanella sp.]